MRLIDLIGEDGQIRLTPVQSGGNALQTLRSHAAKFSQNIKKTGQRGVERRGGGAGARRARIV
ncbi:hypothetical protein GCM10011297_23010 [Bacterioplanes sanyensis]|nr:hypothetical protein GCM10011297_23010 [Bacterioplanes sanyensis]